MPLYNDYGEISLEDHPGFRTGQYYSHTPDIANISTSSGGAFSASGIMLSPFRIRKTITIDRLAIRIAMAFVNSVGRIGIYSPFTSNYFINRLFDSGEMDFSTTGFKEAICSLKLSAGWYWLANNCNIAPMSNTISSTANMQNWHYLGSPSLVNFSNACNYKLDSAYASMPSSISANSLAVTVSPTPIYWFRVA